VECKKESEPPTPVVKFNPVTSDDVKMLTTPKEAMPPPAPVKKTKKRKRAPGPPRPPTRWMLHVKAYKESHKELSYKEVLQAAKLTYTKNADQ